MLSLCAHSLARCAVSLFMSTICSVVCLVRRLYAMIGFICHSCSCSDSSMVPHLVLFWIWTATHAEQKHICANSERTYKGHSKSHNAKSTVNKIKNSLKIAAIQNMWADHAFSIPIKWSKVTSNSNLMNLCIALSFCWNYYCSIQFIASTFFCSLLLLATIWTHSPQHSV